MMGFIKSNIVLSIIICIITFVASSCIARKTIIKNDNFLYDSLSDKIIELCNSYTNNNEKFRYGYKHGAFRKEFIPIEGKYEINCSTFSILIALGISMENSRYARGNNLRIFHSSYTDDILLWFSDSIQIKYSRDIAEKMFNDGYTFFPKDDFSNLNTGDILFFNLDPSNDRSGIDFMGVDHSAIFGYNWGNKYIIYEVGDDKGPQKTLKSKDSMDKIVLIGRMPTTITYCSEPTIIEYKNLEKRIDILGNGKENYNLSEINFGTPLKKGNNYTLFVNAKIKDGIWLNATYNGSNAYAFNMTNVRDYRPDDNTYRIHFTAPEDITKLSINVRSNNVTEVIAELYSYILYKGFILKKYE